MKVNVYQTSVNTENLVFQTYALFQNEWPYLAPALHDILQYQFKFIFVLKKKKHTYIAVGKFGLSTELIMEIDHRTEIEKVDVSSLSPSSERMAKGESL